MPDPRGGKRGTCPPEATPEKILKNVKRHATNWYKCESNTCAFTECKNGRTLVKYGNHRPLIEIKQHRTVTRATQSVRLNREVREGILPPTLLSWQCDWCFLSTNNFQCHETKKRILLSTLFACSIRYNWPLPCSEYLYNQWIGLA